jgi:rubrerythrin
MKTYVCSYCGYKTKKDAKPDKCNYCSKKGGISEVESAEQLIEEL